MKLSEPLIRGSELSFAVPTLQSWLHGPWLGFSLPVEQERSGDAVWRENGRKKQMQCTQLLLTRHGQVSFHWHGPAWIRHGNVMVALSNQLCDLTKATFTSIGYLDATFLAKICVFQIISTKCVLNKIMFENMF